MTKREALIAMGYTESKPGIWLKPIGYQCFSYREDKNEWSNLFKQVDNKIGCWERKQFENEDDSDFNGSYLNQLKGFEGWTRTDICSTSYSHFELSKLDL